MKVKKIKPVCGVTVCVCVVIPSALETVGGEAGGVWRHFTKAKTTYRCS